jgi:hypothetical protein
MVITKGVFSVRPQIARAGKAGTRGVASSAWRRVKGGDPDALARVAIDG